MKIPTGSNNKYNVTNLAGDSNRALEILLEMAVSKQSGDSIRELKNINGKN